MIRISICCCHLKFSSPSEAYGKSLLLHRRYPVLVQKTVSLFGLTFFNVSCINMAHCYYIAFILWICCEIKFFWSIDKCYWMSRNLTFGWYENTFRRLCFMNEFSSSHTVTFGSVSLLNDIRLEHKYFPISETNNSMVGFTSTCSAVRVPCLIC